MRFLTYLLPFLLCHSLSAQRENANWHFGCFAGINFGEDGTITQIPSSLQSREGTASVSDAEGNLLFYTDGTRIFNGQGIIVADNLLGDPSSTTSAVVIPVIGSQTEYWIFTSDVGSQNDGLNYYRYSTTTERLVEGPVLLISDQTEKIAVTPSCGEESFWLVTQTRSGNYLTYSVGNEVIQANDTPTVPSPLASRQTTSYLKFSSDGTRFANALPERAGPSDYGGKVNVYDFDPISGTITDPLTPIILDFNNDENGNFIGFPYGIQFAPGGRFLYVSVTANANLRGFEGGELYQYDLEATDINGSRTLLGQATNRLMSYGALQLGPDGKIYMAMEAANDPTSSCACFSAHPFLGVVEAPDEQGVSAGFTQDAIPLSEGDFQDVCGNRSASGSKLGLPTFISGTISAPSLATTTNTQICAGEETRLLLGEPTPGVEYLITGPDLISQDYRLTVSPEETTTYTVSAVINSCLTREEEVTINVISEVGLAITGARLICQGQTLDLLATTDGTEGSFTWTLPNGEQVMGQRLTLDQPVVGPYAVVFTDNSGCIMISSEVTVSLGEEELISPGIAITSSGGDTIIAGTAVSSGTVVTLSVTGLPNGQNYAYEWTGNFTPSAGSESTITVTVPTNSDQGNEPLRYQVTITPESTGCPVTLTVTLNRIQGDYAIPEVITPNGDGTNDNFRLFYQGSVENFQLIIFNRWGQKVYSANDSERAWDGTVNGVAQNSDVYLYIMSFTLEGVRIKEEGKFSLVR